MLPSDVLMHADRPLVGQAGVPAPEAAGSADAIVLPAECNSFAEAWFRDAGLTHCAADQPIGLVETRGSDGVTTGRFPIVLDRRLGRSPLRCAAIWSHPNCFLTGASASAGAETAAWRQVLTQLSARPRVRALIVEGLVEDGAMHRGLVAAAQGLSLPVAVEQRSVRAMLATTLEPDAYWEQAVRAKKRKELRRQWARLEEMGEVTVGPAEQEAGWIDEFLALEAGGWKGRCGSALASRPDTDRFFRDAMRAGMGSGRVLVTALRLDGRAIAMLITLVGVGRGARAGFSFKTAFDETFARFSPGVLLQRESLSLLASHGLHYIDSCAAQDHSMIDSLWRERRTILSVSLPLPGTANRIAWQAAQVAMRAWHGARAIVRPSAGAAP